MQSFFIDTIVFIGTIKTDKATGTCERFIRRVKNGHFGGIRELKFCTLLMLLRKCEGKKVEEKSHSKQPLMSGLHFATTININT